MSWIHLPGANVNTSLQYRHVSITDPFCGPKYTESHTVPKSKTRTPSSVCPFDVRSKEITL